MDPLLFLSKLQNNYFRADLPSFIIINNNLLKYINNKNMKYEIFYIINSIQKNNPAYKNSGGKFHEYKY